MAKFIVTQDNSSIGYLYIVGVFDTLHRALVEAMEEDEPTWATNDTCRAPFVIEAIQDNGRSCGAFLRIVASEYGVCDKDNPENYVAFIERWARFEDRARIAALIQRLVTRRTEFAKQHNLNQ